MKKFIAGIVVGVVIASVVPAYGAVSSLIGKKVAGESVVKLNGKEIGTAVIIDNKSYLPVRNVANAMDMQVAPKTGEINLTVSIPNDAIESELHTLRTNKGYYEKEIKNLQGIIKNLEEVAIPQAIARVEAKTIESEKQLEEQRVEEFKQTLADKKQQLSDTQTKLDEINARIAELEAAQQ